MTTKLVSFERRGQSSWGLVTGGDGIIDLGARQGGSVLAAMTQGLDWSDLARIADTTEPDVALDEVDLLPPVVCG
ncbi:MAG: 4-hydroxyphenylacetate isomerase, partial [Luminiphilus sp.]